MLNVVRLGGNLTFSEDGIMGDHRAKCPSLIFAEQGAEGWLNGTNPKTSEDGQPGHLWKCQSNGLLAKKNKNSILIISGFLMYL